ncbi:MAG: AMP-binding protein [Ignavibacteriales bacterium]|nr:AMP-binding protein [Ignavibacteriales bacterium]
MTPRTLPNLLEQRAAAYGDNILMWEKQGDGFVGTSYRDMQGLIHRFAAGLMSLGVNAGDRVALIAEGRNDWVMSEMGILYAGAINVPLSVKLNEPTELKFRLAHSGTKIAIVSAAQAPKIRQIKNDLPDLEYTIILDQMEKCAEDELLLSEVLHRGKEFLAQKRSEFDQRWQSVKENDPANICYTSGTTADPKGVVLTHRNYTANAEQAAALLPIPQDYCSLLILPWDHCFAHTAGIFLLMNTGASMASVPVGRSPMETLKNIPGAIKDTKPTFLLSVPALAKNFRKSIETAFKQKGPIAEKLFQKALDVAYRYNGTGNDRGKGKRALLKPAYMLFDKILFSKIRQNFGGRMEFFVGGGALLDIELQRFFYAIGIPMFQGYGLTEASPIISANVPRAHKLGSSGKTVINLEVKICDDKGTALPVGEKGEIVIRGENVMAGYWNNPKASAETVRDGWLYTGDLGYMDSDGFLFVLGRDKSLLISNDGEKYSPEGIEETIAAHSLYIDQVMLYNNQSPYTVALVVANREAILGYLKSHNLSCHTPEGQEAALKLLQGEIDAYNAGGKYAEEFPSRWLPSAVAVLGEPFTEQNGFLNTTLKMVRGKITDFYRSRLDFLYTPEAKDICNHQNLTIIKRREPEG